MFGEDGYGASPVKLNFTRKIIDVAGDIVLAENRRAYNLKETQSYGQDLIKISAGVDNYLGLTADGEVYAWGANKFGQLGNGNNTSSNIPTKVLTPDGTANITDIVEISAGSYFSVISDKDGNVYTFGYNGNYRTATQSTTNLPVKIENLSKIELIGASEGGHTAVVDWDGYVYTVGLNDAGQLGLKDTATRSTFERVGDLQISCNPEKITLHVGETKDISLAIGSSFNLKTDIQENTSTVNRAIENEAIASLSENAVTGLSVGKTTLNADYEGPIGTVNTEIRQFYRNIEVEVLPTDGIVAPKIETGDGFTVSLKADGTVWTWGQNKYGQLGVGNTSSYNEPQQVKIIKETIENEDGTTTEVQDVIKDISVGDYQVLALGETGTVYAWGLGNYGQLGVGNKYSYYTPVVVKDTNNKPLEDIVKVEAGANVSFAINSKGVVYVWGKGYSTKATKLDVIENAVDVTSKYVLSGDGKVYDIATKEELATVGKVVELDEGTDHTVMLTEDQKAYAIGSNTYGQLANGNNVPSEETPVAVRINSEDLFTNIKEIKAGDRITTIVTTDGKVYTAGMNDNNELGIENTQILDRNLPEENTNISNVIFANPGYNHVAVVKDDGTVYVWGNGEQGEIGNRANNSSITPVMVGDYLVRTNTNKVVLQVNEEKVIEGYVAYFNIFNNDVINVDYTSKDSSVVALTDTQGNNSSNATLNADNKFEIKLVGKKTGTTIVTANQENSTNIGVIQVDVVPKTNTASENGITILPNVVTNGSHTISLRVDGKVFTWGDNTYGQLGNGTTISNDEPQEVTFEEGTIITQIAAGENHSVALDSDGNVWTWGRNNNYQIGRSNGDAYTPYKVTGIPKVIRIAAGNNNTMVITENNELYAWGLNAYGDLGLGTYTNKVLPTKVTGIGDIIDISGGRSHFMALNRAGEVFVTGSNLYGQLGIGTTETSKINEFRKIDIAEKIGTIDSGDLSNVVTTVNGYVYAWGSNTYGALGTGDKENKLVPTKINNVQNIRQVEAGRTHTVLRDGNNNVYVSGTNTDGQLGIGTEANKEEFEQNTNINNVLRVSAGNTYTTFLKEDGFVWACGDYNHGDKTKKSKTNSQVPVLVGSDTSSLETMEIVIMKSETQNIMANAKYKFNLIDIEENDRSEFSYKSYNQEIAKIDEDGDILGVREGTTWAKAIDGKTGKVHVAIIRVIDNNPKYKTHVAPNVIAGENFAIGLKEDGTIWTWGYDASGLANTNKPDNINIISTYEKIDAGKNYGVALRTDGTVWAIGDNSYGQLGTGNFENKSKLVQIEGLTDVTSIAAGETHGLAIDSYGIIYGWGSNANGELSSAYVGQNTTKPVIITIPNETIMQISAGKNQSVFVTANGTVYGMGSILNGYLPNVEDAVKVDVGENYILILRNDGCIYKYQNGTLIKVSNASNAIDLSVQNKVNMYQDADEKAYAWGENTNGQLGNGTTKSAAMPTQPQENSTNVFRVGSGYNNTFIIGNTGFVYAAGNNTYGELGNGTSDNEQSTTQTQSLTHTLVGDRSFEIDPASNTLEVNAVEDLSIKATNTFNVFSDKEREISDYNWDSEDETIVKVLDDGQIQGINVGTTKVKATDKITGEAKEATRVIVPVDTDRIESITANEKEAEVTDAYQYEVIVPVDDSETTAVVTIKTKEATDQISIDDRTSWETGKISATVDITNESTTLPFIVKTEAGNELEYTLTIIRQSNNNNLGTLTVNGKDANKVSDTVYEMVVPNSGENVIKATTESEKSSISIKEQQEEPKEQSYTLEMENPTEEVPIKIISESGREENYTLKLYTEDYVTTLNKIIVNNEEATQVDDTNYEVTIIDDIDLSTVKAITNLSTSKVGINGGEKQVNTITEDVTTEGDVTIVTIQVESEDGTLTKEYTLTINIQRGIKQSSDTTLNLVAVNELLGGEDIIATQSTTEEDTYEVQLQNPVTNVKILANTKNEKAEVKIADEEYTVKEASKEITIDSGLTEVLITVKSENGTIKQYTLKIKALPDEVGLKEITVDGEAVTYNNALGRYEIREDATKTLFNIKATAEDSLASVTIKATTGAVTEKGTAQTTENKQGTETIVPIIITAQNGIETATYNLAITEKSDVADIGIVTVNGEEISADEDGNYVVNVASTVTGARMYVEALNEYAIVTLGNRTQNTNNVTLGQYLRENKYVYTIRVVSEDGKNTVEKTLTINRLNGNTDVTNVLVTLPSDTANPKTATLQKDGTYYIKIAREDNVQVTVNLPVATSSVSIDGGESQAQTGTETITLLNDVTEVNILVTAEDGTQETRILKIEKKSNDAGLLTIESSDALKLSYIGQNRYEMQIYDTLTSIDVSAETTNKNAQIKLGTEDDTGYEPNIMSNKTVDLTSVGTSFTIDVLAEDGVTTRTYTVEITKKYDIRLHGITVDDETADIEDSVFSAWANADDTVDMVITPENADAIISVYNESGLVKEQVGEITLSEEMLEDTSSYKIIVTNPNDDFETSTYLLNITKKSTNNNVEYVKLNGKTLTEDAETQSYETEVVTVESDKYVLEVKAEDEYATIKYDEGDYSTGNIQSQAYTILPGETKEIVVTVKSQNGDEITKTVKIYRKENNLNVATVKVNETDITANYDAARKNYYVTLENTLTSTDVEIALESSKSTINATIDENSYSDVTEISAQDVSLPGIGKKVIEFTITSEEGTKETRTITISQFSSNVELEEIKVNGRTATECEDGSYEVEIGSIPNTATIYAKAVESTTSVGINGATPTVGESTVNVPNIVEGELLEVPIKLTSADGTEYEYRLNVKVKSGNNSVESVKVNNVEATKLDDTSYRIFVNQATMTASIDITAESASANVKVMLDDVEQTGNPLNFIQSVPEEKTNLTFTIISESEEEKEYTLEIIKESSDNTLKDVYVNGVKLEKDESTGRYYTSVKEEAGNPVVKVTTNNEYAYVRIALFDENQQQSQNTVELSENKVTTIPITVRSQTGITNIEYIDIEKIYSSKVDSLVVDGNEVTQYDEKNKMYTAIVDKNIEEHEVFIMSSNTYATLEINEDIGVGSVTTFATMDDDVDVRTLTFTITSESDETTSYKLRLIKKSSNVSLTEIVVNDVKILPDEDRPDVYRKGIKKLADKAKIKVVTQYPYAQIKIGDSDATEGSDEVWVDLNLGQEVITVPVVVTATDGETIATYNIILKRLSNDTSATVSYNDEELVKDENGKYNVSILDTEETGIINVVTNHENASVDIAETLEYELGGKEYTLSIDTENAGRTIEVPITVVAEDGTIENSTLEITRISTNNNTAKVEGTFDADGTSVTKEATIDNDGNYFIGVRKLTDEITLKITPESEYAVVTRGDETGKGELTTNVTITDKTTYVNYTVTSEAGETKEYTVKITRQAVIKGTILTENAEGKNNSQVIAYKTSDTRPEDIENILNEDGTLNTNVREVMAKTETNEDGTFEIEVDVSEEYDIVVIKDGYLSYRVTGIETEDEEIELEPYNLLAGDVVETGEIEIDDLVSLNDNYGVVITDENKEEKSIYDLNEDGTVDKLDRNILKANYGKKAETVEWVNPNAAANGISLMSLDDENEAISTNSAFILPMTCSYTITSEYGYRIHPITGEKTFHSGIDIVGTHNTEILAVADGVVTYAGVQSGYGNCIEIKHTVNGETVYTFYAHLSKIDVAVGQKVSKGDVIGLEGGDPETDPNPGTSTGHHLHFEVRSTSCLYGTPTRVDPNTYIDF